MRRPAFRFSLVLLLGLLGCRPSAEPEVPYYGTPDFTPQWFANSEEAAPQIAHTVGAFRLNNQAGAVVTEQAVRGKIHVANFMFTRCPATCPKLTDAFNQVQTAFADQPDVLLLSFSVMPWADSVAQLRQYAQTHDVKPGKWHLLTGPKASIYNLARRSYFAEETPGFTKDSSQFLHTEHLVLVDRSGRLRGLYKGTQALETERLVADIRALLEE
ncbi:MAG: SCO family protein [Cytophagaceae bacterium]|nr:SCO family protein [Cytophagaceae bacterium]